MHRDEHVTVLEQWIVPQTLGLGQSTQKARKVYVRHKSQMGSRVRHTHLVATLSRYNFQPLTTIEHLPPQLSSTARIGRPCGQRHPHIRGASSYIFRTANGRLRIGALIASAFGKFPCTCSSSYSYDLHFPCSVSLTKSGSCPTSPG